MTEQRTDQRTYSKFNLLRDGNTYEGYCCRLDSCLTKNFIHKGLNVPSYICFKNKDMYRFSSKIKLKIRRKKEKKGYTDTLFLLNWDKAWDNQKRRSISFTFYLSNLDVTCRKIDMTVSSESSCNLSTYK